MKEKVLLIAGCSHSCGSEIDGTEDSQYNRQHSFGNQLANKLSRRAINIGSNASTNQSIARSILDWVNSKYDAGSMDLMVLVAWTESSRLEFPAEWKYWYERANGATDWMSMVSRDYARLNPAWEPGSEHEKKFNNIYKDLIVNHPVFVETITANLVLQIEYLLKYKSIDYVMCNTMYMFTKNKHTEFFIDLIDKTNYLNIADNDLTFWEKYRKLGYTNPKAKYWHHNEQAHSDFANILLDFIQKRT